MARGPLHRISPPYAPVVPGKCHRRGIDENTGKHLHRNRRVLWIPIPHPPSNQTRWRRDFRPFEIVQRQMPKTGYVYLSSGEDVIVYTCMVRRMGYVVPQIFEKLSLHLYGILTPSEGG